MNNINNMNREELEKYIDEWLQRPIEELRELTEQNRLKAEASKNRYLEVKKENERLTARYRALESGMSSVKIIRFKTTKTINKLKENMEILVNKLNDLDGDLGAVFGEFQTIHEKTKEVKRLYEEKCLEIRATREEFKIQLDKIKTDMMEAELALSHKKESKMANQQVLQSKLACLEKDMEECAEKEKKLKELIKENNENVLKGLEKEEENMKKEFSALSAKLTGLNKVLGDLEAQKASLIANSEKISLEIASEEKRNEKLEAELKSKDESLKQLVVEMVSSEAKAIHRDNLELAKSLRDDLIKNDGILKEIEVMEKGKAETEKKNQELLVLKDLKHNEIKQLEADIAATAEEKKDLDKKADELKSYIADKQEFVSQLKMKIAEREAMLKKQNEQAETQGATSEATQGTTSKPTQAATPKATQPTKSKATQPKSSKTRETKKSKATRSAQLKRKEPLPQSTPPKIAEEMSVSIADLSSDQFVFSSASSDSDFSLSTSMAGTKPDIMNIIENLSSNQFSSVGKLTARRDTINTESTTDQ